MLFDKHNCDTWPPFGELVIISVEWDGPKDAISFSAKWHMPEAYWQVWLPNGDTQMHDFYGAPIWWSPQSVNKRPEIDQ